MLFIANSPYHIILSTAFALQHKNIDNIILVIIDFSNSNRFLQNFFNEWDFNPFKKIYLLERIKKGYFEWFFKIHFKIMNIYKLKKILRLHSPREIYIFNDLRQDIQSIIRYGNRNNLKCIYIEDGIGAYAKSKYNDNINLFNILRNKILYGFNYQSTNVIGTTKWINEIFVCFPNMAIEELKLKQIKPIPYQWLINLIDMNFFDDVLNFYFVKNHKSIDYNYVVIILLDQFIATDDLDDTYIKKMISLIKNLLDLDLKVAIKYHPDEIKEYLNDIFKEEENLIVLPKNIASEFFLYNKFTNLKLLIGTQSTALYSSKWITKPKIDVISIYFNTPPSESIKKLYDKIGIICLNYSKCLEYIKTKYSYPSSV